MAVSVMAPEILSLSGYNTADLASGFPAEGNFTGLDLSLLEGDVDEDVVTQSLQFTRLSGKKANLRLAHVDLGSGTDAEQRMFDLRAERELRTTERAVHVGKKSESAKQKDFAVSAQNEARCHCWYRGSRSETCGDRHGATGIRDSPVLVSLVPALLAAPSPVRELCRPP